MILKPLPQLAVCLILLLALNGFGNEAGRSKLISGASGLETPITMNTAGTSLAQVVDLLCSQASLSVVSSVDLKDYMVKLKLQAVPLQQVLDLAIRSAGLEYEIAGNAVLIRKETGAKKSAYVLQLRHIDAAQASEMLRDISPEIQVDAAGNRLICYVTPREFAEAKKVVDAVDRPVPMVLLKTRLLEISEDKARDLGIRWSELSRLRTTVAYPAGKLVEPIATGRWDHSGLTLEAAVDLLVRSGAADILMDARLVATSKWDAQVQVASVIPYEIQTFLPGDGGRSVPQIQEEEVGIKVRMIPQVSDTNEILLSVEPEISSLTDFIGTQNNLPLTRVRRSSTRIRVQSGQRVFVAGLLSEEETETITKVPLLGEIPFLGIPFRHLEKNVRKLTLLLEITPEIILDPQDLENVDHWMEPDHTQRDAK